jgi:hypothetical protein
MSSSGLPAYSGPIPVWMLVPAIDKAVKEFADEEGLEPVIRPHDQHIWYVGKRGAFDSDFFQQVQVAVFYRQGDDGPAIFFTPVAYIANNGDIRTVPSGRATPCMLDLNKLGRQQHEPIKKELRDAWGRAQQLKRTDVLAKPVSGQS